MRDRTWSRFARAALVALHAVAGALDEEAARAGEGAGEIVYARAPRMVRTLAKVGLAACALVVARPAGAFLIVGTDAAQGPGPEMRVLVLHERGRNVVAIAPAVRGPAKPLAVVVPLPKAAAGSLAAAPVTIFERADRLAAPRADELWELDPCLLHPGHRSAPPSPSAAAAPATSAAAAATASAAAASTAPAADIGGYEVTVLDAAASAAGAKWLADHGYALPEGAADLLAAAAKDGAQLAVARIDGARLTFDRGVARLPPLSFVTDGPPSLPLRLLRAGAGADVDLVVDVLSPGVRLEAGAPWTNVAVPTNLDVREAAKADLDGLHRALVDYTFEKTPGAALTEHAWLATGDGGGPEGAGLGADDLLAAGVERLPSAADGSQREVIVEVPESLARAPEGPPALKPAIAACYARTLGEMSGLAGEAKVIVETGDGGAVKSTKIQEASAEALGRCVEEAARATRMDRANERGTISARFALVSRAYLGQMVLTRLRVRAGKGALSDVELRPAAAIEGGREEGPTGEAEKKVRFAEHTNNFRARYVVRHPWSGPVPCDDPKRGVWGPRPRNAPPERPPATAAAPSSAAAATAQASGAAAPPSAAERTLVELLAGGELPDLSAYSIPFRAAEPPAPPPATAPATPSAVAPAAPASTGPSAAGGCGCGTAASSGAPGAWAAISAIVCLLRRARRRNR